MTFFDVRYGLLEALLDFASGQLMMLRLARWPLEMALWAVSRSLPVIFF